MYRRLDILLELDRRKAAGGQQLYVGLVGGDIDRGIRYDNVAVPSATVSLNGQQQTHPTPGIEGGVENILLLQYIYRFTARNTSKSKQYLLVVFAGEDLLVHHVFKSFLAEKLSRHFNAVSQRRHVFPEKSNVTRAYQAM